MNKFNNKLRGRRAQKEGKTFEQLIINCARRENIAIKKSDPALKQAPSKSGKTIFWRERSGADFLIGINNKAIIFDAKSFGSDRISHSQLVPHQLFDLKLWNDAGFKSGYLINFRRPDKVVWLNISCLLKLKTGESIHADEGCLLGTEFSFSLLKLFSNEETQCKAKLESKTL